MPRLMPSLTALAYDPSVQAKVANEFSAGVQPSAVSDDQSGVTVTDAGPAAECPLPQAVSERVAITAVAAPRSALKRWCAMRTPCGCRCQSDEIGTLAYALDGNDYLLSIICQEVVSSETT